MESSSVAPKKFVGCRCTTLATYAPSISEKIIQTSQVFFVVAAERPESKPGLPRLNKNHTQIVRVNLAPSRRFRQQRRQRARSDSTGTSGYRGAPDIRCRGLPGGGHQIVRKHAGIFIQIRAAVDKYRLGRKPPDKVSAKTVFVEHSRRVGDVCADIRSRAPGNRRPPPSPVHTVKAEIL